MDLLDKALRKFAERVAEEIKEMSRDSGRLITHSLCSVIDGLRSDERQLFSSLFFSETGLSWIKELKVFLKFNNETGEDDFCVLDNTAEYVWNNVTRSFSRKDVRYVLEDASENEEILYQQNNNSVDTASVLMYFRKGSERLSDEDNSLTYIIMHELTHIYDMFIKKQNQEQLNKNIIVSAAIKRNFFNTGLYLSLVNGRRDVSKLIRRLDAETLQYFICETSYLVNESELGARISNFLSDISTLTGDEIRQQDNETIYNMMCRCSATFDEIFRLYIIYDKLVSEASDTLKDEYVSRYIKEFWSKKTPCGLYPYDSDFRFDGRFARKSFDLFMENISSHIWLRFINPCENLIEKISVMLNEEFKKHSSPLMRFSQTYSTTRFLSERKQFESKIRIADISSLKESIRWAVF